MEDGINQGQVVKVYWVLDEAHKDSGWISSALPSPAEDYPLCTSAKVNPPTRGCFNVSVTSLSNVHFGHLGSKDLTVCHSSRCMWVFF